MPRNVRNWWLKLDVDGKASPVEAGPASKDGSFELVIYQRDRGMVNLAGTLRGLVNGSELNLQFIGEDGTLTLFSTQR